MKDLGRLYKKLKNNTEAKLWLRKCLEVIPNDDFIYELLGSI